VETTDVLELMLDINAAPAGGLSALIAESHRSQSLVLGLLKVAQIPGRK
jgi:hypothetical protein